MNKSISSSSKKKSSLKSPTDFKKNSLGLNSNNKKPSIKIDNSITKEAENIHLRQSLKLNYSLDLKQITNLPIKENKTEFSKETKKIIKSSKIGSNKQVKLLSQPLESNLAVELEDPSNEYLRVDIQKIMQLIGEVNTLNNDYYQLEEIRKEIKDEVNDLKEKNSNLLDNNLINTKCKYFLY